MPAFWIPQWKLHEQPIASRGMNPGNPVAGSVSPDFGFAGCCLPSNRFAIAQLLWILKLARWRNQSPGHPRKSLSRVPRPCRDCHQLPVRFRPEARWALYSIATPSIASSITCRSSTRASTALHFGRQRWRDWNRSPSWEEATIWPALSEPICPNATKMPWRFLFDRWPLPCPTSMT